MKVDIFDFDLPPEFIASRPLENREEARLLLVPELADRHVRDLPDIIPQNALVVMNDTKVIPARITGTTGNRHFEATLHKNLSPRTWLAFVKNSRKLSVGDTLEFSENLHARVAAKHDTGEVELEFDLENTRFFAELAEIGTMPLPPYIKRSADKNDDENYQTVYAKNEGAVAAPTAGLHFTNALLERMRAKGIELATLTLHVGAGTFLPVKANDTDDHKMHSEYGIITPETAAQINAAKQGGRPLVAIGTTTLRLLESATDSSGKVQPFKAETNIFITPGYRFKTADFLLTNFHIPRSTLFMLVCAFAGIETMKNAYEHAKSAGYRFYSYGDATLLRRMD
ncbi:MAG: tRNA preQ1(34) S-adenosylmethionine ribosyltransferase-isomerase QueA [Rickettsiales bacterium]|jgi:S-adenosylmethionine:tRNA ribosyltransferase-isomerase|nr:tRNA preQ1(34) S-adenosylmethionine ribosyltransferase-isomerase QueA [Rickettsiales bacterium]